MADFIFSMPDGEETADTLIKLYKTLSVMFSNLDSKNVKELLTGKTKISSGDGLCEISGAQILMRDKSGERLTIGADDDGNFVFILKNKEGDEALSLSSEGEAVFSGDIKTEKNAEVGNSLYLGRNDKSIGKKVLQFYDDETNDLEKVRIEAVKDEKGYVSLKIIADTITLSTFDGVRDGYGNSFVTTNFKPYVEIDGVKYYVNFK